jgi:MinD-like ATPase involved in chromosome partitioning or flagellar assembly
MRTASPVRTPGGRHGARGHRTRLVAVHSIRGGSGKSHLAANLAFLAARGGARVAALDADLQAPTLHALFGIEPKQVLHSLSEYIQGRCEIGEVPIDLTRQLGIESHDGKLHCIPSSSDLETMTSILFEGYDVARLNEGLHTLAQDLELDYLLVDTHLGFNRETLLCLAICDTALVLLRPDRLDHGGAGVLVEIATKLGIPSLLLVPNMISEHELEEVGAQVAEEFGVPVAGVLPWCEELRGFGDRLFAAHNPDHPFTQALERICQQALLVDVQQEGPHDLDHGRVVRGPESGCPLRGGDEGGSG